MVRRLAQHDVAPGQPVHRQPQPPCQRVRRDGPAQVQQPAGRQHARDLAQHRVAVGHVLQHVAHVDQVERRVGQSRRLEIAVRHLDAERSRLFDRRRGQFDAAHRPAAIGGVAQQATRRGADLEQTAGRTQALERVDQPAVLVRERRRVERVRVGAAAAEVLLEVLRGVHRRQRFAHGLDAQEPHAAAAAARGGERGVTVFIAHGEPREVAAAAGEAAIEGAGLEHGRPSRAG